MTRFVIRLILVITVLGCGDDDPDVVTAASEPDSSANTPLLSDSGAVPGHDASLQGESAAGNECESSADCQGGKCVKTDDGGYCSAQCEGAGCEAACLAVCAAGSTCVHSGEDNWLCVSVYGALCRPCTSAANCIEVSGTARCLSYGDKSFCGALCDDDNPCPENYTCQDLPGGSQCSRSTGSCLNSPEPEPEPELKPEPEPEPEPEKEPTACYQGENNQWDVCFPLVAADSIESADYTWPKLSGAPDKVQYAPPTYLLDLEHAPADKKLAPNFKLSELMQLHKGRWAVFSPKALSYVQKVRSKLGVPLTVNSGFRSPGYNKPLPGAAKYSRHMYGDAVDVTTKGKTSLQAIADACKSQDANFIKKYTSHVHCDWRAKPLNKAYWHTGSQKPGAWAHSDEPRDPIEAFVELHSDGYRAGEPIWLTAHWAGFDEGLPWVQWQVMGPSGTYSVGPTASLTIVPPVPGVYTVTWDVGLVVQGKRRLVIR